jgi:hypothetical protein
MDRTSPATQGGAADVGASVASGVVLIIVTGMSQFVPAIFLKKNWIIGKSSQKKQCSNSNLSKEHYKDKHPNHIIADYNTQ